jgi:hypothetical protein
VRRAIATLVNKELQKQQQQQQQQHLLMFENVELLGIQAAKVTSTASPPSSSSSTGVVFDVVISPVSPSGSVAAAALKSSLIANAGSMVGSVTVALSLAFQRSLSQALAAVSKSSIGVAAATVGSVSEATILPAGFRLGVLDASVNPAVSFPPLPSKPDPVYKVAWTAQQQHEEHAYLIPLFKLPKHTNSSSHCSPRGHTCETHLHELCALPIHFCCACAHFLISHAFRIR